MSDILSSSQTLVGHSERTNWSDLVEWSVEVDFLVAKEKSSQTYTAEADGRTRWACPATESNPTAACVEHCAEHLARTFMSKPCVQGAVAYKNDSAAPDDLAFTIEKPVKGEEPSGGDHRMAYWLFTPARNAIATSSSPGDYDWVGVRLRCPYTSLLSILPGDRYGDQDLGRGTAQPGMAPISPFRGKIEMETVLGLLRADIKIHSNSTCQLRVYMNLQHEGFDLTDAKKALTLVWLLEPELLLALRPETKDPKLSHYVPITESSNIAMRPSKFLQEGSLDRDERERILALSRPSFPVEAEIMDNCIPQLKNQLLQERIHMIWSAVTLPELSGMLKNTAGEMTVALDLAPDTKPKLVFHYGLWHPQREAMQYWLHLFGRLFLFAVASDAKRFRTAVTSIEEKIAEVERMEPKDRMEAMLTHSFDHALSHYWNALKRAEQSGGCLSTTALDGQGIMEVGSSGNYAVDSESSSSSSSNEGLWLRRS
ncbi:hypothetical protein B0J15DRAFT_535079 [Fusarium solani]|uniref:Uncharacterized protein n=1 Tax=Fusarium solani TaxID=169388 RepID=A0A9P9HN90_FUSSL|nr:uncharacterized protein B0J15DRAFT_535079 [Fusarium solani]KAH7260177.1 hypothetical protein B0J15DRAFT_535079 [Fusarium solani]